MRLVRQGPLVQGAQVAASVVIAVALFSGAGWALSDVTLYYRWTGQILDGQIPYRDFFFDYPPLSLPALMAPRALSAFSDVTYGTYLVLFAACMAGLSIALFQVIRSVMRRLMTATAGRPALTWHLVLMTLSLPVLLIRYDLWPILLVALAFLSTLDRRPVAAGAWLGVAIAAKLYAIVLLPLFAGYWLWSSGRTAAVRHLSIAVATVAVTVLPFALLAGESIGDLVRFQQGRGLQVETAAGGVIQLLNAVWGEGLQVIHTGTYELVSDRVDSFLTVQPLIAFGAVGLSLAVGAYRLRHAAAVGRAPEMLAAVGTACLIAFMLTNRALSPQHVFWCLSFAALLAGYRHHLLAAVIILTLAVFPLLYQQLLAQEVLPILVLNARNVLLALLAVVLLVRPVAAQAERAGRVGERIAQRSG